ncbi:MAG: DNA repair protein RecO, partial [Kiritimatiellae bacterium]|nr:DNA repair protein RecO [Kiritimatiellia bacterium]
MILKDTALLLRAHPFSNTSRIAVWLTRDHGKLATLMKGAHRPRSPFLGQADLFYTCEILFYARETRQLHILKECTALDPRPRFRADWRSCAAASYLCCLADLSLPFGPFGPDYFTLLEIALDHLATAPVGPSWLLSHEARWLHALGFLPDPGSPTLSLSPPARALLSAFLTPSAPLPPSLPKPLY